MYSSEIIERRLFQAKKNGLQFNRLPRTKSIEISKKLELLQFDNRGNRLPEGQLIRELDDREQAFIRSERILCKADFAYYLSRYHCIERDEGVGTESGIGPASLIESQHSFIKMLGIREDAVYKEVQEYGYSEGIRAYAHKARQVAFTTTSRALSLHRMLFYPGTRSFACGLNPDGAGEIYKRDKIALDNLPFWIRPSSDQIYPDVKDTELGFTAPINSRLLIQFENQKQGIGVGTQQDVSHLTEVSLWSFPFQIAFSFCPALPKSKNTLHIQEATSYGKGNYWQEVTEACRRREKGYESWTYIFVPVYLNRNKYRAIPPSNWTPQDHTIKYAELVERTSPEWCEGRTYRPPLDHLYWWETERARHCKEDKLAFFLANYPATPEQSFANFGQGALPVELLEAMELDCRTPRPYEIQVSA